MVFSLPLYNISSTWLPAHDRKTVKYLLPKQLISLFIRKPIQINSWSSPGVTEMIKPDCMQTYTLPPIISYTEHRLTFFFPFVRLLWESYLLSMIQYGSGPTLSTSFQPMADLLTHISSIVNSTAALYRLNHHFYTIFFADIYLAMIQSMIYSCFPTWVDRINPCAN